MADKNWIQDVNKGMEERGTKGSFTKQAKRADMSVKDFAEDVKRNPDKFTKRTRQRANLAQTFENMNNKKSEKMATGGKTQGYNDKLNESLGMRTGEGTTTEQSYKDRRDESKGANKNLGIRATSKSRNESKLTENKLLKQSALSPAEYQKAKKLKGFDPKNYMWDPKQDLHLIRKMSESALTERKITIEGNPYGDGADGELGDFFIYRDGVEVVSWNRDELAEDEDVEDLAKEMFYLWKNDEEELGKRLDRISYAKAGFGRIYAKGGTLSEKAVKKNYIRRDRYDKLKKEKDAKIDELKDANKDKISDLKKDLKDKGADCYDNIKQTKKDIGKKIAKEMQKKQLDYEKGCDDEINEMSKDCDSQVENMAELGNSIQGNMSERAKKENTESFMLGGLGGLLLGFFLSR
jgi:hypothetical protein